NIAKNGSNQFDGSISFLIGSSPKFLIASNGNVGIGTLTPAAALDVRGVLAVTSNNQIGTPLQVTSAYTGGTATDATSAPIAAAFFGGSPGGVIGAAGTRGALASGGMGGLGSGTTGGSGGIGLHALGGVGGNS